MKHLDVSQLIEVSAQLGIEENVQDLKELTDVILRISQRIAKKTGTNTAGVSVDGRGVLAGFYPTNSEEKCPEIFESHDDCGSWIPAEKKTVLICDDDTNVQLVLKATLEAKGLRVLTASRAEEAWLIFNQNTVNMLVTDIVLPGKDGYWLAEEVAKATHETRRFPVVTISGEERPSVAVGNAEKLGCVMHMPKPVDWEGVANFAEERLQLDSCASNGNYH